MRTNTNKVEKIKILAAPSVLHQETDDIKLSECTLSLKKFFENRRSNL